MSKIPTAKEFIKLNAPCSIEGFLIEFAKLHVQEALKKASENVKTKSIFKKQGRSGYSNYIQKTVLDKRSILNAYPLENIK